MHNILFLAKIIVLRIKKAFKDSVNIFHYYVQLHKISYRGRNSTWYFIMKIQQRIFLMIYFQKSKFKMYVNRDSHTASSRISQFFLCLFLIVTWGSMLLDFYSLAKKASWIHRIFKISCRVKFSIKHHSILMYSRTKLQLDNSTVAWARQFWAKNSKSQKIWTVQSIMAKFNTKGPWSNIRV